MCGITGAFRDNGRKPGMPIAALCSGPSSTSSSGTGLFIDPSTGSGSSRAPSRDDSSPIERSYGVGPVGADGRALAASGLLGVSH